MSIEKTICFDNFSKFINLFKEGNNNITVKTTGRGKTYRYASFDYCYSYFYNFYKNDIIEEIASDENLEKSCLHISNYLASWGMFRGSSYLLQKSIKFFEPLVRNIAKKENKIFWEIDLSNYEKNICNLIRCKNLIKDNLYDKEFKIKPTNTLITKVMLGVFSNFPALDTNFCKIFKIRSVNEKNILKLYNIYDINKNEFSRPSKIKVYDFDNISNLNLVYNNVKLLDMYGFQKGLELSKK